MSKQLTIGLPTVVATVLSLLAGAFQVFLVSNLFAVPPAWREMGIVVLVFFAGIGINPLVGHSFYAALKLKPGIANLIAALLAAATTATTTLTLPPLTQAIILGVLTVAAGLGFQPVSPVMGGIGTPTTPPPPPPKPVAVLVPAARVAPVPPPPAPEPAPPAPQEGEPQGFVG
jgi:uncharacterized membrane protein